MKFKGDGRRFPQAFCIYEGGLFPSSFDGTIIARTVTVSVSPQQVAALAQAQSTGNLSLSLVGAEDDTVAAAIQVDQHALLGIRWTTHSAIA